MQIHALEAGRGWRTVAVGVTQGCFGCLYNQAGSVPSAQHGCIVGFSILQIRALAAMCRELSIAGGLWIASEFVWGSIEVDGRAVVLSFHGRYNTINRWWTKC